MAAVSTLTMLLTLTSFFIEGLLICPSHETLPTCRLDLGPTLVLGRATLGPHEGRPGRATEAPKGRPKGRPQPLARPKPASIPLMIFCWCLLPPLCLIRNLPTQVLLLLGKPTCSCMEDSSSSPPLTPFPCTPLALSLTLPSLGVVLSS